jgi:transposase-like protein
VANEVNTNLLFKWRRRFRAGVFDDGARAMLTLLLVVIADSSVVIASTAPDGANQTLTERQRRQ